MSDYWHECIAEAFDDAKITATEEQIVNVAGWAESAHDNYGMAHGHDCIPNPETERADRVTKELATERAKVVCPECGGRGSITTNAAHCNRSSTSECWKCRGEGKVSP